jgi:hypothetical protein
VAEAARDAALATRQAALAKLGASETAERAAGGLADRRQWLQAAQASAEARLAAPGLGVTERGGIRAQIVGARVSEMGLGIEAKPLAEQGVVRAQQAQAIAQAANRITDDWNQAVKALTGLEASSAQQAAAFQQIAALIKQNAEKFTNTLR